MCSLELNAVYIDTQNGQSRGTSCRDGSPESTDKVSAGSSGIGSKSSSIASNNNFPNLARKRNLSPDAAGEVLYDGPFDDIEMDKIRRLMAHVDGDMRVSSSSIASSHRGSIEPSLMSTVFAVVLVIIISISVYAFTSLYRAVMKRMSNS